MSVRKLVFSFALCASILAISCSRRPAPVRTYPMGERVQLGQLIYTVFETQWMTHFGEGLNQRVPQNRYFLVRMSITNAGSVDTMVPAMSVVDDSGQIHAELSNGDGVPQWIGYLRNVKPAESAQGNILFDAAPKHYKLRITDETEQEVRMIDIPLSFATETPAVSTPQPANP